jgi:hypothetical protein
MKSSTSASVDVMQVAAEAAQKLGAVCPEGVAEYLKDKLTVVNTAAGPQVVVRNGLEVESLDGVLARMQVTDNVAALFHGGKLDLRKLDHDLFRVIRAHRPEWLGLRKKRKYA